VPPGKESPMKGRLVLPALLAVLLFFSSGMVLDPPVSCGQENRAGAVIPDEEKRSSIHEVDGYAYLSENMTLSQVRAAALATAKRQALEMARTYVTSKTHVKDFEVRYDLIWTDAEGAVKVLEQKDLGIEGNSRYHVWVRAEVEYSLKRKERFPEKGSDMDPGLPLQVRVWSSRKHYRQGDRIEIFLQGNRDFYARVVDVDASGNIVQLLPNAYRKEASFRAGDIYRIPGEGDRFQLEVVPPFGEDRIVVYASEVPLGDVNLEPAGKGLGIYRGSPRSLGEKSRGIAVTENGGSSGAEFYEAAWKLTTGK